MPKKPGKPGNRRSKIKHASLVPRFNTRVRQEYVDIDYIDELNDVDRTVELPNGKMVTEREYMSLFMDEWNNASVGKQSKAEENAFHRTAKEVKDCTDRSNWRNNDGQGAVKAQGKMMKQDYFSITHMFEDQDRTNLNEQEDTVIEILDRIRDLDDPVDDSD